jgi:acyl-CoA synthetase (AMP-forming)/AMP-acid ligase II
MLLHELVTAAAATAPDRTALVVDDEVTTFSQLDERTAALAAAIRLHAVPGDRVAFLAENGPEWVDAYYGVPRAGCRLAFVNHRLGPVPLRAMVERFRPTVVIADRERLDLLASTQGPPLAPTVVVLDGPAGEGELAYADLLASGRDVPVPDVDVSPDDVAWLIGTSGTSGTPKVVQLTHRNVLGAVRNTRSVRTIGPDDAFLTPFPLCHVAGYNVLLFHHEALPVVVVRRFTAAGVLAQVERNRVTTASLAPTMIHAIVEHLAATGDPVPPTLHAVTYGSSGIAPSLLAEAIEVLGVDLHQGYGMTELGGNAAFLGPEEHRRGLAGEPRLLTCAGRPGPLVQIRLLDDDDHEVPTGQRGEIVVRGEQVTIGYWESDEANATGFVDGWLRTGDVGCFDDAGYLSVVDRKKDIIVSGGENVSSRAVEDALVAHPDVAEVAVVGAPDERWGEVVCAYVVPRAGRGLTEEEVLAFGREAVGGFQQPRRVLLVPELPRNATGKVLKHELRARLADGPG